jgi:flagellar hook-length control protein FliK
VIDALLPNNHDGNTGKISGKMDCTKKGCDTDSSAGFSQDRPGCVNFSELYTRISECNRNALVNDDDDQELPQVEDDQSNTDVINAVDFQFLLQLQDLTEEGGAVDDGTNAVASELIKEALQTITATLGLPDRGIDKLNISEATESTVEQFAEIVYALNQIVSALDVPGNDATISQLNGAGDTEKSIDVDLQSTSQSGMSSALRVELFKLQMGMQLLGISAEVQGKIADLGQRISMNGMNQATDPSAIAMPVEQISALFGKALDLMNKDKADKGTIDAKPGNVWTDINVDHQEKEEGILKQFDTQTYRTLLNVDKVEKNSENSKGDHLEKKDDLITILNADAAIIQDGTKDARMPEFTVAADVQHIKVDLPGQQSLTQEKITSALRRMGDESSVVDQITGKLTSVIRSGSNEVRIQLRPESLGEVSLSIKMEGDVVFTKIQVESQQVKQIVESNLQVLKDALASQNLSAGHIDVSVGNNDNGNGNLDWDLHRHQDGQGRMHDTNEQKTQDDQNDIVRTNRVFTGNDTGIRYGNNSIEYFA